ncbi:YlbE family protein [Natronincola ferrireducens]|uniref:DUF1116 domain-containing protein n=1 Tax=Natronincola ferrireducens TaxID=393762 RepID=A0A1G9G0M9_9FIRM|nr:DUF1116 domain-containing protein [Natronincola ferrireducens]SDK94228.1 Protein of unknown function [Natronincola ferrireducens]
MKQIIDQANKIAIERMLNAQAVWVDIKPAHEVVEGMDKYTLLHAGPPIEWSNMSGPMKGAVIAALKYEGVAKDDKEALDLAEEGKIKFSPCHHHSAVGPMTGITSYSMPLYVVENKDQGNFAYSTINEGAGDVLRFGAHSDNTVKRLKWIEEVLAPVLKKVVNSMGGINLNVITAQALHMGDELHMRNGSSTAVFIKTIINALVDVVEDKNELKEITKFLTTNNDQFFLNLAMCACKISGDAAHGVENSTIVTAMARNGVNIGIRVSGLGDQWFTAPAAAVEGLYFSGFTAKDANPDIGDSAIMETGGVGGFAMATAPAIVKFLGAGGYQDAINYTMDMYEICDTENSQYTIPNLDFRGTPTGIDIRKVVETGIAPAINTAIASKEPGVGMIGAGVSRAPIKMFEDALVAFAEKMNL